MRCADQLAGGVVGPAVQRADDIAARVAAPLEHHRLAVPADVGDQFDAAGVAHQGPSFGLLGQGVKVAHLGHSQGMTEVLRAAGEQLLLLALVEARVEVAAHRQLAGRLQQSKAQIGHVGGL